MSSFTVVDIGDSNCKNERVLLKHNRIQKSTTRETSLESSLKKINKRVKKKHHKVKRDISKNISSSNKKRIRNALSRLKTYKRNKENCLLLSEKYCVSIDEVVALLQVRIHNARRKILDLEKPMVVDTKYYSLWGVDQMENIIYKVLSCNKYY
tara:strand:- start:953 stop:1411 length:459 start_codon:yes stop_codon:yes gene_type:complete